VVAAVVAQALQATAVQVGLVVTMAPVAAAVAQVTALAALLVALVVQARPAL
jgi:hypothetical protein